MSFLVVWAKTIIIKPGAMASALVAFAEYFVCQLDRFAVVRPEDRAQFKKLITLTILLTLTLANARSVRLVKSMQKTFFWIILIPIMLIISFGVKNMINPIKTDSELIIDYSKTGPTYFKDCDSFSAKVTIISAYALAFYQTMWSYDGWQAMSYCVEEIKNPEKNLPYSSILGTLLVTCLYLLMNKSYFSAIPISYAFEPSGTTAMAIVFIRKSMGSLGNILPLFETLIAIGILCANYNTALANMFTTSRITFVAARHGQLPKFINFIDVVHRTPSVAIWLNSFFVFVLLGE